MNTRIAVWKCGHGQRSWKAWDPLIKVSLGSMTYSIENLIDSLKRIAS